MSAGASNLTLDSQTQVSNHHADFVISWTKPDPTHGVPPNGWYGVHTQYSSDGTSWTDSVFVQTTDAGANTWTLSQHGMDDLNDPSPRLLHWRLKTLFLYRSPLYSNEIEVSVSNIVDESKVPASNLRGACQ